MCVLLTPYILITTAYKIKKNTNISYVFKKKYNADFKYISNLIFIETPKAAIYRIVYTILKKKYGSNEKISTKQIIFFIYNYMIISILGAPL
jgi:hypothetical protein